MITKPINRGDIVLVNFGDNPGSVQNGYRPAVILQRNRYNKSSTTTIVAPITSVTKRTKMSSHVFIGRRFGLLERSMVLLEQIQTIDQDAIDTCVGHIKDDDIMRRINEGLRAVLELNDNDFDATHVLERCKTSEGESYLLVSVMLCASALDVEIHIVIAVSASFEQAVQGTSVIFAITARVLITQSLDY